MPDAVYLPIPRGDFVLPFDIPHAGVRGRLVRLEASSARALAAHALPEEAARVAGETLALAAILGSALKLDGRLTVQTKSSGPLDLVAADYYGSQPAQGEDKGARPGKSRGVRGLARLDAERFEALTDKSFAALLGAGALGITIEPRIGDQRYQGIVELASSGIADSAQNYFAQSEQLPTVLRLAAAPLFTPGGDGPQWRAAGLMLQQTPGTQGDADDWTRLSLITRTVEDSELVDFALAPEDLLWRLFHEDEVRVQPAETIAFRCDCDASRIASVLRSYSAAEREGLADPDGVIRARCEFCGAAHEIAPTQLG